jgi:hypothetical protein
MSFDAVVRRCEKARRARKVRDSESGATSARATRTSVDKRSERYYYKQTSLSSSETKRCTLWVEISEDKLHQSCLQLAAIALGVCQISGEMYV